MSYPISFTVSLPWQAVSGLGLSELSERTQRRCCTRQMTAKTNPIAAPIMAAVAVVRTNALDNLRQPRR